MTKISTIVFDLGGVLIDWDPRNLYRKFMPEADMEWFLKNVCNQEWNERQDEGRSFAEAIRERSRHFPSHAQHIQTYFDRWIEMIQGPIPGTVDIFYELKDAGFQMLALSNWSAETFPLAEERYPFLKEFHGRIISGQEKLKKPDPKIFQLLIERHALDPQEAVFIDDVEKNIQAARGVGLTAIHFQNSEKLRVELKKLGILD